MHRIVFLGTPDFAVEPLQALLDDDRFDVVAIVSQPDRPAGRKMRVSPSAVSQVALKNKILLYRPEKIKTVLSDLKELKADSAVVVAYGQILPQAFFDLFPKEAVNIHGSLLPRWRGAAPIQRALMAGDKVTGVSLQKMVKKLDAGDVIAERKIDVAPDMTVEELYSALKTLGADLLKNEFAEFLDGKLKPKPQDESQVTFAPKIEKSEGKLDWAASAEDIYNRFRGLKAWPGVWTHYKDKRLKILDMSLEDALAETSSPGTISVSPRGLLVDCQPGRILLKEVQPSSKGPMSAADFVRGYQVKEGEVFNV